MSELPLYDVINMKYYLRYKRDIIVFYNNMNGTEVHHGKQNKSGTQGRASLTCGIKTVNVIKIMEWNRVAKREGTKN